MVRCPICEAVQIGFLLSPRPTSCFYCGATWLQDGSEQTAVRDARPDSDSDEVAADGDEPGLLSARGGGSG
jgi:hypothetical protein